MSYAAFADRLGLVNDLLCTVSVLQWDFRTQMAPGSVAGRSQQISSVTMMARETLLSAETRHALDQAEAATQHLGEETLERQSIAQVRAAIAVHDAIPAELLRRKTELAVTAHDIWAEARRTNDFGLFAPALDETVSIQKQLAEAIGYSDTPYDALISIYEPGTTSADLKPLFAQLRAGLRPVLQRVADAPAPRTDFMYRAYPLDKQREIVAHLARTLGFDANRGRIDQAVHPFEVSFGRDDVRITTRYSANCIIPSIQGAIHETGHALYEQGIAPELARTVMTTDLIGLYAVGGISFGTHESQARLWENHVGRSRLFWDKHFGTLRDAFPDSLGDVTADEFWRAFSAVRPGPIRVEADELSYDFHIMLRVDLERDMIEGRLKVADLPEAWNAGMLDGLGIAVPENRLGVLQDVHWSTGQIGTFCNYTVGNVMAAQLFEHAQQNPAIVAGLEAGDYAPLRLWLTDGLYRHGRRYDRKTVLRNAIGKGDDAQPYITYLTNKYTELYQLEGQTA